MKNLILAYLLTVTTATSFAASKLKYDTVVDLSKYQGQTYFSLMQQVIKPDLDQYAANGFTVVDGATAVAALKKIDSSVAARAVRAAGSEDKLKEVADSLSAGKAVNFYNLPDALAKLGVGAGRYDLTTYLALVSGGGVAVKLDKNNTAYNVNYGAGDTDKDEMTGRSFGEAPGSLALDASDKHYLEILEKYVRSDKDNVQHFYRSILQILLNSDASDLANVTEQGQAVVTDFLAVYTAEQDRHLMSNLKTHPWDESLLEVTLLSALHSGQKKVMVMFNGAFTDTTLEQAPGCTDASTRKPQPASMVDYWQFSASTDPTNCKRSGLNITRKDFRNLGVALTAYELQNHPELIQNIQRHFTGTRDSNNVFAQLSDFLINAKTASQLDADTLQLADDFTAFLMQVREDADTTSTYISSQIQASR